jgi:hypothetical protein
LIAVPPKTPTITGDAMSYLGIGDLIATYATVFVLVGAVVIATIVEIVWSRKE